MDHSNDDSVDQSMQGQATSELQREQLASINAFALLGFGTALQIIENEDEIARLTANSVSSALSVKFGAVVLQSENESDKRIFGQLNNAPPKDKQIQEILSFLSPARLDTHLFTTESYHEIEVRKEQLPEIGAVGICRLLAVQLKTFDKDFGVILAGKSSDKPFTSAQRATLETLASQASIALHRIELNKERAAQETILRESEKRFRRLVEHAADSFFLIDSKGKFIDVNQRACEFLKFTREELLTKFVWEIATNLTPQRYLEIGKQLAPDVPITMETTHKRKDGTTFPVEIRLCMFESEGRQLTLALARDITERKQAEESLLKWEQIFQHAGWGVAIADPKTHVLQTVNPAFAKMHGYTVEEILGSSLADLFTPEDRAKLPARARIVHEKDRLVYESIHLRKDGSRFPVLTDVMAIKDRDGKVVYRAANFQDITDRKLSEEALRKSEERYRNLYNHTPVMMHSIDRNGKLVNVNDHWLKTLGYERGELLGRKSIEFLTEASRHYAMEVTLPEFMKTGSARDVEYQMVKNNGEVIDVLLSAIAEKDREGKISHSLAFIVDITERKRAEEALRKAHDELELRVKERTKELAKANAQLKEQIAERKRAEQAVRRHAKRLETLQEIDRDILAARSPEAIVHAALRHIQHLVPCIQASVAEFDFENDEGIVIATHVHGKTKVGTGEHLPLEVFGLTEELRQGKVRLVDDAQSPGQPLVVQKLMAEGVRSFINVPLNSQGNLIGTLNLASDRPSAFSTEHVDIAREVADSLAIAIQQARLHEQVQHHAEELERRVAERTAELEGFSYSVSHDLRAPLRAIDGFSRILLEDYTDKVDAECNRLLNVIRSNTQNMGHLIDDLLVFSRLGRKEMQLTEINLEELAKSVFEELKATTDQREVNLTIKKLPSITGDRSMIRQVFMNLISNAIKFTGPKQTAKIEIGTKKEDDKEYICHVKDSGVGFDMKYSDKLFGVFQRLHTTDEFEGTGVGLAIVKRIIDRHGGRVWAEGKVDKGATIYFTLPRKGGKP